MRVVVVTGSGGLIGSQSVASFSSEADLVIGIDNDMRSEFFGPEASTQWAVDRLKAGYSNYEHVAADIRDRDAIERLFEKHGEDIDLIVHTAAQPSHDWAARDPHTDFSVNAVGTLNLLEANRQFGGAAPFIFTSTNKVYGDTPNHLPLIEQEQRWELDESHDWHEHGIPESMSIDMTTHSVFGASKVAADVMVQEYGRYFEMPTACFRGGCLTGPDHSGAELHGFLAYLMKCVATGKPYTVFGYKGKQVRDNIHSLDLVAAFDQFRREPRVGEVYNIGGGRTVNCSMIEAIALCEEIAGTKLDWSYAEDNRIGDHMWWVSDTRRFESHYPNWKLEHSLRDILTEIHGASLRRADNGDPAAT